MPLPPELHRQEGEPFSHWVERLQEASRAARAEYDAAEAAYLLERARLVRELEEFEAREDAKARKMMQRRGEIHESLEFAQREARSAGGRPYLPQAEYARPERT